MRHAISATVVAILMLFAAEPTSACRARWIARLQKTIHDILHEDPDEELVKVTKQQANSGSPKVKTVAGLSLFFLSERLGKDKYVEPVFFDQSLMMYNDRDGCYEEGHSQSYSGRARVSASGVVCEKWGVITAFLRDQIWTLEEAKAARMLKRRWHFVMRESTREEDTYIRIANDTIRRMERKGLIQHNMCRDPDNTGLPWCFVKLDNQVAWEPCAIPKCTPCWRIRQNARKWTGILMKLWKPMCNEDGSFMPLQCYGKYCWCSDRRGKIINGTFTDIRYKSVPYCEPNYYPDVPNFHATRVDKSVGRRKSSGRRTTAREHITVGKASTGGMPKRESVHKWRLEDETATTRGLQKDKSQANKSSTQKNQKRRKKLSKKK